MQRGIPAMARSGGNTAVSGIFHLLIPIMMLYFEAVLILITSTIEPLIFGNNNNLIINFLKS